MQHSEKIWLCLFTVCIGMLLGCRTSATHTAARLPPQLAPPPERLAHEIDWARIQQAELDSNRIYRGDSLKIEVKTGLENGNIPQFIARVDAVGNVDIPLIGPVRVDQLQMDEAAAAIRDAGVRNGVFVNPKVTIDVQQRRTHKVTVVGAVNEPATYEIPAEGADLVAAIAAAGGLADDADTIIDIRRPSAGSAGVRQASFSAEGPVDTQQVDLVSPDIQMQNLRLEDGAVVKVHQRPERSVNVMGLVKKPNRYAIPTGAEIRLLDAIAMAGGTTLSICDRVIIVRQNPDGSGAATIETSISEAKASDAANLRLAADDVVNVEETTATAVVGVLKDFFRVGFSAALPGM